MIKMANVIFDRHKGKRMKIFGKEYVVDHEADGGKIVFREVDYKKHKERVEKIADRILEKTDHKKWIMQSLLGLELEAIRGIEKELKKKRVRIKDTDGCYEIKIGKETVEFIH